MTHAKGGFIDVGANIGLYTVMMARKLDRDSTVLAFEPDRSNFEILKVNVHLNGTDNVILHNLGLWLEEGELPLFADPKNPVLKSSLTLKPTQKLHGQVAQVDTLDHIMETGDVQCNLIKIDVEGAEVEVLKGAIQTLRRYKPDVIFECWTEEELGAIEQLLMPMGYVISSTQQEAYYLASVHEIQTNRK
jgi:FkbM family methyltransferase